jgi:phage/plasmid-like protein (TIGR03299 family)
MATGNLVVTKRDLPFLKYRVDAVLSPDEIGDMTVETALAALGLDFTVESRKVYTHTPKGHRVTVPGFTANVRTDTEEVVGVVGDRYKVVQNVDALGPIGNALSATGEALIESAWSLRGGRSMGATFRIPSLDFEVPGDAGGAIQMFLMIQNSHDGNSSITGHAGPVRLACLNMISLYERSAVSKFKIRHTAGASVKLDDARNLLGLVARYREAMAGDVRKLVEKQISEIVAREILQDAFPVRADATDAQRENSTQFALFRNWRESDTIADVRETGWGFVNAVNEYFEHLAPVNVRSYDRDSVRGISILQGTAHQATNRIAELVRAA